MKLGRQRKSHKGRASLMIIASQTQFHIYLPWGQCPFSIVSCLNSVLNVKAVVAAFNQEKALVGAFSVIVKADCETDGSSAALPRTHAAACSLQPAPAPAPGQTAQMQQKIFNARSAGHRAARGWRGRAAAGQTLPCVTVPWRSHEHP